MSYQHSNTHLSGAFMMQHQVWGGGSVGRNQTSSFAPIFFASMFVLEHLDAEGGMTEIIQA
jgi:hypothetical protein